jgi:hypothetical protein
MGRCWLTSWVLPLPLLRWSSGRHAQNLHLQGTLIIRPVTRKTPDLNQAQRYYLLAWKDVAQNELTAAGWQPIPPKKGDGDPSQWRSFIRKPFAIWSVHKRKDDHGDEQDRSDSACCTSAATVLRHSTLFIAEVPARQMLW